MIGEIKSLHPAFKIAVNRILRDMAAKGWHPVIGSGMRTNEEQDALYAQGRRSLAEVNAMRLRVKFPPIKTAENKKVTKAKGGQSNHNLTEFFIPSGPANVDVVNGYAVDIVDAKKGWDITDDQFWQDLGSLAKKYGCEWGGDWAPPDRAHVQMKLIDSAGRSTVAV